MNIVWSFGTSHCAVSLLMKSLTLGATKVVGFGVIGLFVTDVGSHLSSHAHAQTLCPFPIRHLRPSCKTSRAPAILLQVYEAPDFTSAYMNVPRFLPQNIWLLVLYAPVNVHCC
ncbi:hypothetical protein FCV25MIE_08949 [Fagus crenata]